MLNFAVVIYVPINLGLHSFSRAHSFHWLRNCFRCYEKYAYTRASLVLPLHLCIEIGIGVRIIILLLLVLVVVLLLLLLLYAATFGPLHFCQQWLSLWHVWGFFRFQNLLLRNRTTQNITFLVVVRHQNHFMPMCAYELIDWWVFSFGPINKWIQF